MRLPERTVAPKKRNETTQLVQPIIRALNRLPGVRVARNANLGPVVPWAQRWVEDARPIVAGLGTGSADIVGIVDVNAGTMMRETPWGRAFALEVKLPAAPGLRAGTLAKDQARWAAAFVRFGGFCCVVHSIAEACAAVERCRAGHAE